MISLPPPLSELERRLGVEVGSLSGADKARAEEAITDATYLALAEVSVATATAWGADPANGGTGAPGVVLTVILKAARREYENPQNLSQESLGDYSRTVTASGVYLTDREAKQVRRAASPNTHPGGFVGTVRTPSAYDD